MWRGGWGIYSFFCLEGASSARLCVACEGAARALRRLSTSTMVAKRKLWRSRGARAHAPPPLRRGANGCDRCWQLVLAASFADLERSIRCELLRGGVSFSRLSVGRVDVAYVVVDSARARFAQFFQARPLFSPLGEGVEATQPLPRGQNASMNKNCQPLLPYKRVSRAEEAAVRGNTRASQTALTELFCVCLARWGNAWGPKQGAARRRCPQTGNQRLFLGGVSPGQVGRGGERTATTTSRGVGKQMRGASA
jgi:hypothetical protein